MLLKWDDSLSTELTNAFAKELALWHLTQAKECESSVDIRRLVFSDDLVQLCHYELDYGDTTMLPDTAYHLRQVLALYSKRADLDLGIDKEAVAFQKFVASEDLCRETNTIFRLHARGLFQFDPDVDSVLHAASRKIARVLGVVPSMDRLKFRFGPGATTQVKKQDASARRKLSSSFACSEDLLSMLPSVLSEVPGWLDMKLHWREPTYVLEPSEDGVSDTLWEESQALLDIQVVPGKLAFVPKTAKEHRSIVVEPMLNGFVQLGIGDYIAARLSRFGVDLRDQSRNQRLALKGSLTGALATLDLSSASDTISRELVCHLLPLDWFLLLDHARTGWVEYGGKMLQLEKFSSMGNGFTFPLESLIFWALAVASTEATGLPLDDVAVYGDDIIVPGAAFDLLTKVLRAVGFIPNPRKSFNAGPFRESCGKDYLSGIDIRPVYLRDTLTGESAFTLHNFYVRSMQPEAASIVLKWIHPELRLWGPDKYGDGHLIGDWNPLPHGRDKGWAGCIFDTFTWKSRKSFERLPGDCVLPCYSIYASPPVQFFEREPLLNPDVLGRSYWYGESVGFRNRGWRLRTEMCTYADQPSAVSYRKGRPGFGVTVPGVAGYKRISIYTLQVS